MQPRVGGFATALKFWKLPRSFTARYSPSLARPGMGCFPSQGTVLRRLQKSRIVEPLAMDFAEITCPTCFEVFEVALPHPDEMPAEVDYDCEVCCRPMAIVFTSEEVYARGLAD